MGKKSREKMTGKTEEERVSHARGIGGRIVRKFNLWMKPHSNTHRANNSRGV